MPSGNGGDTRSAGRSSRDVSEAKEEVEPGATAAQALPVAVFAGTAVLHVAVWAAIPLSFRARLLAGGILMVGFCHEIYH